MTCHAFKVLGEALGHVDDEDGVLVKVGQIGLIIMPIVSQCSSQKFEKSHSMLEGVWWHPFSNFYKFSKRSHRILNKITIHAGRCMTTSKQSWLKRLRHWRRWNNGWRYELFWVYFITQSFTLMIQKQWQFSSFPGSECRDQRHPVRVWKRSTRLPWQHQVFWMKYAKAYHMF